MVIILIIILKYGKLLFTLVQGGSQQGVLLAHASLLVMALNWTARGRGGRRCCSAVACAENIVAVVRDEQPVARRVVAHNSRDLMRRCFEMYRTS